jgi:hypothetical protein
MPETVILNLADDIYRAHQDLVKVSILHKICVVDNRVLKTRPDLPFQLHVFQIEMKTKFLHADWG